MVEHKKLEKPKTQRREVAAKEAKEWKSHKGAKTTDN